MVAMISVVLLAVPARAGGVWDPNDPGHHLDIRWAGIYELPDDRFMTTVVFYDRVRKQ
jgi:hypothetical protein